MDDGSNIEALPETPLEWGLFMAKLLGVVVIYCAIAGIGLDLALWDNYAPLIW